VRDACAFWSVVSLLILIPLAGILVVFPGSKPVTDPILARPLATIRHDHRIVSLAISPDSRRMASSDIEGFVSQRDLLGAEPPDISQLRPVSSPGLFYTREGRVVAVTAWDDRVWWQDGDEWHARRIPDLVGGPLASLSPDGGHFACYCRDEGTIRMWTRPACETRATLEGHRARISALAVTPDGQAVATGDCEGIIKVWDPGTGRERASWRAHTEDVLDLSFTRDGTRLASVSLVDMRVRLWDGADGQLRGEIAFPRPIRALDFTPDGTHLVLGGLDGVVRFVGVATLREQARFRASTEQIRKLRISPDGRFLVTAAGDNRVRVWHLAVVRSLRTAATGP
jgi:WD40 repeat protein